MYKKRTSENDSFKKKSLCFPVFGVLFLSLFLLIPAQITEIVVE